MTALVVIGHADSSRATEVILAVLRMQSPDTEGSLGFCVVDNLTTTSKVALEAVAQLSVAAAMAVVYVAVTLGLRAKHNFCQRVTIPGGQRYLLFSGYPAGLLAASNEVGGYGAVDNAGVGPGLAAMGIEASEAGSRVIVVQGSLSHRARVVTAAANFLLTAYATLTVATIKMLHCVWVPGTPSHERRLFIRGTQVCDYTGWQLPYFLVLALLTAAPLLLPFVSIWSIQTRGAALHRAGPPTFKDDLRRGLRRALVESYNDNAPWWESVLMAQRLVLAMVYTFASSDPGVQSLFLTLLCVGFFAWHLLTAPLRSQQSQTLQSMMLLACLVGVALSELPFTIQLEKGVAPNETHVTFTSDTAGRRMQTAFRVVLPGIAVAWAHATDWVLYRAGGYRAVFRQGVLRWRRRQAAKKTAGAV